MTADQRTAVAEQLGISPSVLAGLDEPSRSLPGEAGGHSVYQITFANGATYVGSTGGRVLDRLEQHFGADPGQPAPSITVAAVRGFGTFAIVSRAVAGIAWRVVVLASGLSEQRARDRARVWRGSLDKPIQ